jgi:hypothetical protein
VVAAASAGAPQTGKRTTSMELEGEAVLLLKEWEPVPMTKAHTQQLESRCWAGGP